MDVNSLKQRLAEKIKKAAEERKKENAINVNVKQQEPSQSRQQLEITTKLQKGTQNNPQKMIPEQSPDQPDEEVIEIYSFREQQQMKNPFIIQPQQKPQTEEQIQRQIKLIVQQKETRKKDEQEEKKRNLMMIAIKNKDKKRFSKPMDKPTPFNELSPPYQQMKIFASYLPIYNERRQRQLYTKIIDLGVKNLPEVVLQCFLQGIISKSFMKSIKQRSVEHEIDFIRKFATNKLDEYDFVATKFTPLDHRWLCCRLMNLPDGRGQKYVLGERIYCIFKEITDFYEVIYEMEEQKYQRLCETLRIKYNLSWRESAFQSYQPLNLQNVKNFETASVFQLRPSPLFGAVLNDDQKQFFRAKKQKYPNKVRPQSTKQPKADNPKQENNQNRHSSSSEQSSSYSDSSAESIQKELQMQSSIMPSSSIRKSSLFNSVAGKAKSKGSESYSVDSISDSKGSSMISEESEQRDEGSGSYGDMQDQIDMGSIARSGSISQSASRRKSQPKKGKVQGKPLTKKKGTKKKPSSNRMESDSEQKDDIFDDA